MLVNVFVSVTFMEIKHCGLLHLKDPITLSVGYSFAYPRPQKQWMVRNYQENTFVRIMFTIKMVLIKFNFFYFLVNKSLWVASLEEL